ncbi:MAG: anthranilate phosphoribosyltransferase [Candidatus Omnitrophica bacterium]|nr:anthranilate phosphoribosyltransferase [Candidatus Omnitrophota bacterium]
MSATQLLLTPVKAGDYLSAPNLQTKFKQFFTESESAVQTLDIKKTLLCLAKRGESPAEVWALIQLIESMEGRVKTGLRGVIDVCGTGGDGMNTFNISTVSAFVIAGAGGFVAKHGNRAISSRCGSSDLMDALGVNLSAGPKKMLLALKTAGIAYMHAPLYHPLFAKIQPLRQSLGVRTLFNLTGPFLNPFEHPYQMIGVSKPEQIDFFISILKLKKIKHAAVCHSHDGLDEISTSAPTDIAELRDGKVTRWTLKPTQFGFKKAKISDYAGGNVAANKKLTIALLQGKLLGPVRDVVEVNAGMGLYLSGKAKDLKAGVLLARQSIDQKGALKALETLIRISNS